MGAYVNRQLLGDTGSRQLNYVAHNLANWALSTSSSWLVDVPPYQANDCNLRSTTCIYRKYLRYNPEKVFLTMGLRNRGTFPLEQQNDDFRISHDDITFALNPGEVDEPQEANQVLLGKIISRHRFGNASIQGSLKLSWNAIKGWKRKEIGDGIIQFTFARREDALNVLARRPWFICGALIVIMPWPAWLSPAEVRFDKTHWELASKASPVFELPPGVEDTIGMSTLRFRATIDINKLMFLGFFLRRQRLKDLWLQYKYERLPKLYFKCGALTHDQSVCFKSPTIIKDANGNFYPMFRVWLKSDASEKSTFTTPLDKWFQDWVLQKRLCHDPILQNQMKVHKAIQNGEPAEIRECRRQHPGKKRIVTHNEKAVGDTQSELVITQLPLVYLPGIGEITPFGNNSKLVSIQDLQEAAKQYAAAQTKKKLGSNGDQGSFSMQGPALVMGTNGNNSSLEETNAYNIGTSQTDIPFWKSSGKTTTDTGKQRNPANQSISGQEPMEPNNLFRNSILGSQAQFIDWPSKECWAQPKARELLMGSLTEHLHGPRKRKTSDGLLFRPNTKPISTPSSSTQWVRNDNDSPCQRNTSEEDDSQVKTNTQVNLTGVPNESNYSPGYDGETKPSSKRGRRQAKSHVAPVEAGARKRRGRLPKTQSPLAATPKSFKKGNNAKSKLGGNSTTINHREDKNL
ncbi:hypothetical protein G4B88_005544 [Cannabis sativa]|uniref:DUF4283 domain-containing protein n=1 Tax=Cannabis sativa TaxID=3483 RepID=A0A7J6H856_CANSA|nr:hypothetical protein G4B88_005544 [Cannabis sativa]